MHKVYCELFTGKRHRRQIAYPTTSTSRTSISSLSARRESSVSVQSATRGLPQFVRQCSDAANVVVHRRNSEMTMGPKAKVTFSPLLEYKGDEGDGQRLLEEPGMVDQEKSFVDAGQKKRITDVDLAEKTTSIDQDKKTTNADQQKETATNVDQDKKTTVDQEEETATNVDQDNKRIFVVEDEGSN